MCSTVGLASYLQGACRSERAQRSPCRCGTVSAQHQRALYTRTTRIAVDECWRRGRLRSIVFLVAPPAAVAREELVSAPHVGAVRLHLRVLRVHVDSMWICWWIWEDESRVLEELEYVKFVCGHSPQGSALFCFTPISSLNPFCVFRRKPPRAIPPGLVASVHRFPTWCGRSS